MIGLGGPNRSAAGLPIAVTATPETTAAVTTAAATIHDRADLVMGISPGKKLG
jgi:hypothetical protein